MNFFQLQHLLNGAAANANSRPLSFMRSENSDTFAGTPVTPFELVFGRPFNNLNINSSEDARINDYAKYRRQRLLLQKANWRRFYNDYLLSQRVRQKWNLSDNQCLKPNQVVLIRDKNQAANTWKIGLVLNSCPSRDGQIKKYKIKLPNGSQIIRHVNNISVFESDK